MKAIIRKSIILLFSGIVLWCIGWQIEQLSNRPPDVAEYAKTLEKKLHSAEVEVNVVFNNASFLINAINKELGIDSIIAYEKLPYSLLIYNDSDSLLYWNNNKVQPYKSDYQFEETPVRRMHEIAGSKYLMLKKPYEPVINQVPYRYSIIALIPLHLRFAINNDYLDNHFPLMPAEFSRYVDVGSEDSTYSVKDSEGNILMQLKAKEKIPYRGYIVWAFIFYILASIFILASFYRISSGFSKRWGFYKGFLLYIGLIICFRLITVYAEIPRAATLLPIFQTHFSLNHSLWFYSLGDFLIDMGLAAWISLFLVHQSRFKGYQRWSALQSWGFALLVYAVIVTAVQFVQSVLIGIINNSDIYFEFEDFSKIDLFSFYALLGIVSLFICFFLVGNKLIRMLMHCDIPNAVHIAIGSAVLLTIIGIGLASDLGWLRSIYTLFFSVSSVLMFMLFSKEKLLTLVWVSLWLFFFSFMATVLLEQSNVERSYSKREEFLKELLQERDYNLEEASLKLEKDIANDEFFKVYLSSPYVPYSQVLERLSYLYLDNAFFGRYQYKVNIYNAAGIAKRPEHIEFDELKPLFAQSEKTISENLYFYSDPYSRYSYWLVIPLKNKGNLSGTIAIEFTPIAESTESSVYIELMSNSQNKKNKKSEELAYAFYKSNQKILSQNGNFSSFIAYNAKIPKQGEFEEYQEGGKNYLAYRSKKDYIGIVEIPLTSILKPFSIFSYLFCAGIFAILFLFMMVWLSRKFYKVQLLFIKFKVSLRERIQQGIVFVSLLSFIAIGIITILFFQDEYNNYHKSRLERKIDSVEKTAAWQIVSSDDSLVKIPNAKELSAIHKIDVNIYSVEGHLLSSSEDAVFGRRLISREMNPVAYFRMKNEQLNKLTLPEEINHFKYLSGYVPLKDKQNQVVAFLNLPYDFAGNRNLQSQDVAKFLGTLLNVYVIFLLLAAVVAFILANSVTRPLSIIGEKLREIQLGGTNERIDWKSRDEDINEFIDRYNHMIEQLDASTRELARTQRETAWREMARQVAHEIKNPLTPMKLQIQLLERAADKDSEKAKEMIKKVAKSLIEQIDSLAHIASEFSNFAKMPAAKNEHFILNNLVESVYTLFSEEHNMVLELNICDEKLSIFADKDQILRVLNNLVKNAIQAIPSERPGLVTISLQKTAYYAVIKVSDNGVGIPEDRKENIFVPYFTTKTSGTGIGLAMSKNIVESAKGQIYFESKEGVGTDFYVELPL